MYWDYADVLLHTEKMERERLKRTWFEARHQKSEDIEKDMKQNLKVRGISFSVF